MVIERSHPLALFASLVVLGASSLAQAQASTGELRDDGAGDSRIAGELGLYVYDVGENELAVFQPSIYGTFRLAEPTETTLVDLDVAWRFAGSAGDTSAFRAGNPYLGVRAGFHDRDAGLRVRGGVGLTAPLTNAYDDYRDALDGGIGGILSIGFANAMQGAWDAWLMSSLNMAVVLRGDFEYRQELFAVGAEAAFAALLPVEYEGQTGDTVLDLQLGVWGAARPIPELAVGLRFSAVMLDSTGEGDDPEGFLALMPFVRGEIGTGFVEGRLLMNLDEPYGFAFDDGRVWAAYLLGGAAF